MYLGMQITSNEHEEQKITGRIVKGNRKYEMHQTLLKSKIRPTVTYGSEIWRPTKN